ncbi:MAG: DUF1073 domain-containing protein [Desulfovibrio sp.]|jgi:phage-related protein (TIGR01555 family)|nr:DUF1073 domain-containing protein [Desulfovibrio sp.]
MGVKKRPMKINAGILDGLAARRPLPLTPEQLADLYMPPRTLGATEKDQLAMDAELKAVGFHSLLSHAVGLGMGMEEIAPQFLGYPYLAGLSQNALIRAGVTTVAEEMTKRWVEVKRLGKAQVDANGDGEDDKVKALSTALEDFGIQGLFNEAAQKCDFDGGCLIYIDTGETDDAVLGKELFLDGSILKGKVKRFTLVEAVNLYPGHYNATDPLAPDYFTPDSWLVLGKRIHKSRFLYFAPSKLPMLLRPAYNFFGLPAAQQALDYVAHFTKTREAAQRLLTKFSLTVFKSNVMSTILSGGGTSVLDMRMAYLAQHRDNDAILLIDKDAEDVIKLETPLAGVTDVVRQSLEFVAAIFRIPFVKFLGISPGGLNATGEADLRNFYDHVGSKQEKILRRPLNRVLDILQFHLFGAVDPEIKAEFVPLADEDDAQKATTLKTEADRDAVYLDRGVLDPGEVRRKLSDDPASGYGFINPEMVPEGPEGEGPEGQGGGEGAAPEDPDPGAGAPAEDEFWEARR